MKLCLGILAYNEESRIARTLGDVLEQDVWGRGDVEGRVVVVVNGSRDATAARAREVLEARGEEGMWAVHELERAGKANAWNEFVHRLSGGDVEVFVLADADIRLPERDALSRMVDTLLGSEGAAGCVDVPRKDFSGTGLPGWVKGLSASASALAAKGPPKLCGQLYAARGEALRSIFLPEPLLVEDGLIKAMLVTRNFTAAEDAGRLVRAEGVYHLYEPETGLGGYYRHEKRIFLGTLCNFVLFDLLREAAARGEEPGGWMRGQQEADGEWFRKRLAAHFAEAGSRKALWTLVRAPLAGLRHVRGMAWVKALPAALVRFGLALWVGAGTARDLKRNRYAW